MSSIKKSDIIQEGAIDEIRKDLDRAAASLSKFDEELKQSAQTISSKLEPSMRKTAKAIREVNKAEIESERLVREKLKNEGEVIKNQKLQEQLKQTELRTQAQLNREKEKEAKTAARKAKQLEAENNAYKRLVAQTRKLKNESKTLAAEMLRLEQAGKRNTKEYRQLSGQYRAMTKEVKRADKAIKKIDANAGDFFRNVGNYRSGLSKLNGVLGQFGAALGIGVVMRDAIGVIRDFDQAQADLASVLGVNVDEMGALTEQAKELGATTTFTAAQVSELQKELAKLGFSQVEIERMTEGVLSLAEATGTELSEAATVAGATLNGFGLDASEAGRVSDVMAKSFSSSALDMSKFSTAMSAVAPVANQFGFSVEQTTAMLGKLVDNGIDASTAGTALRNILLQANKAGLTFNEAMEKINGSTDKSGTALELFGTRGATVATVLAENQEQVAGLTDKLEKSAGAADEMAKKQRDTLGGALKELRSAYEGYILGVDGATGASEGLKTVIQQLARNLPQIVSAIGKLIKAFVAFKAVMLSIKMAERFREWQTYNREIKKGTQGMKGATTAAKGFGRAMKSIGFAALISVVLELAQAWYRVASGAKQAEEFSRRYANAQTKGGEAAQKNIDEINTKIKEQINLLRDQRAAEEITEQQYLESVKQLNEAKQQQLRNSIDIVAARKREALASLEAAKAERKAFFERLGGEDAARSLAGLGELGSGGGNKIVSDRLAQLDAAVRKYGATVGGTTARLDAYRGALSETKDVITDLSIDITANGTSLDSMGSSAEEQTEAFEEAKKATKAFDLYVFAATSTYKMFKEALVFKDKEFKKFKKALDERLTAINDAERLGTITTEQAAEQRVIAELDHLLQRQELLRNMGIKSAELELAISEKRLELVNMGGEEYVEAVADTGADALEVWEGVQQSMTDALTDQIDQRIAELDREADAAKQQQETLQALAAQGNIYAQQSISEAIEAQREAQAEQIRLERLKQRVEAISAGLQVFTSEVEGGASPTEALTKTITTTQVLSEILKNIPFFADGTLDAPEGWAVVDEKGPEIITDMRGKIKDLGTTQGPRFKYLSKGDKVHTAEESAAVLRGIDEQHNSSATRSASGATSANYDAMLLSEMQKMRGDLAKAKTDINVNWHALASGIGKISVSRNTGGDKRTERYTVRP